MIFHDRYLDADYEIIISTGDQAFDAPVVLKIRGDHGIVSIPLSKSKSGEKPFRSKAIDEFTCRTNDVGKIKRITFEHEGHDDKLVWHIKSVQIKKDNETHKFEMIDEIFDLIDRLVLSLMFISITKKTESIFIQWVLFLVIRKKIMFKVNYDDYEKVFEWNQLNYDHQISESISLMFSRRIYSFHFSKLHEPFVFNDLSPYFDTSPVERAIYSVNELEIAMRFDFVFSLQPNNAPPGYYNRITALGIVEPWQAHGMDYGVSYEFLKQRKSRSLSSKRP